MVIGVRDSSSRQLTVFDIGPLLLIPSTWQVCELIFDIGVPSNIIVRNGNIRDCFTLIVTAPQLKRIIEIALGNQSTWECSCVWIKHCDSIVGSFYSSKVCICRDRVAIAKLVYSEFHARKLLVGPALHVAAMVLIEVVQLVVDVDRLRDVAVYVDSCSTTYRRCATSVILVDDALDFLAHYIEGNSEG